jgi:hypothetical protein
MLARDILFIALAVGFVVVAFFLSMALFMFTQVLKNLKKVTNDIAQKWAEWSESITTFARIVSILNKVGTPIIKMAEWAGKIRDYVEKKIEKRRSKKDEEE